MFKLVFRLHAIQRMFSRNITETEVRYIVESGDTIEAYNEDIPYPSKLILGRCGSRTFHAVVAISIESDEIIVITVYEPDPHLWDNNFKKRRVK